MELPQYYLTVVKLQDLNGKPVYIANLIVSIAASDSSVIKCKQEANGIPLYQGHGQFYDYGILCSSFNMTKSAQNTGKLKCYKSIDTSNMSQQYDTNFVGSLYVFQNLDMPPIKFMGFNFQKHILNVQIN